MSDNQTAPEANAPAATPQPGALSQWIFRHRALWLIGLVVLGVGLDQGTKIWARSTLMREQTVVRRAGQEGEVKPAGDKSTPLHLDHRPVIRAQKKRPGGPVLVRLSDSAETVGACNKKRLPQGEDGYVLDVNAQTVTLQGACVPKEAAQVQVSYMRDKRLVGTETVVVIPQLFNFKYRENPAAAFSLTGSIPSWLRRPMLILVSSIAMILFAVIYFLLRRPDGLLMTAFALIIAGAIGNFIDRLRFGYVVDFIDWYLGFTNLPPWPTFNIADMCIVVGALSVVYRTLRPLYPEDEDNASDPGAQQSDKAAPAS